MADDGSHGVVPLSKGQYPSLRTGPSRLLVAVHMLKLITGLLASHQGPRMYTLGVAVYPSGTAS